MKRAPLAIAFLLLGGCASSHVVTPRERLPILDMHMHARTASHYGTPPLPICAPVERMPRWDQRKPMWEDPTAPPVCTNPIFSPATDDELLRQTVATMERHNVIGVLGGSPELVSAWMAAAPGRFLAGLDIRFDRVTGAMSTPVPPGAPPRPLSLEEIRELHAAGKLAVLDSSLFASRRNTSPRSGASGYKATAAARKPSHSPLRSSGNRNT